MGAKNPIVHVYDLKLKRLSKKVGSRSKKEILEYNQQEYDRIAYLLEDAFFKRLNSEDPEYRAAAYFILYTTQQQNKTTMLSILSDINPKYDKNNKTVVNSRLNDPKYLPKDLQERFEKTKTEKQNKEFSVGKDFLDFEYLRTQTKKGNPFIDLDIFGGLTHAERQRIVNRTIGSIQSYKSNLANYENYLKEYKREQQEWEANEFINKYKEFMKKNNYKKPVPRLGDINFLEFLKENVETSIAYPKRKYKNDTTRVKKILDLNPELNELRELIKRHAENMWNSGGFKPKNPPVYAHYSPTLQFSDFSIDKNNNKIYLKKVRTEKGFVDLVIAADLDKRLVDNTGRLTKLYFKKIGKKWVGYAVERQELFSPAEENIVCGVDLRVEGLAYIIRQNDEIITAGVLKDGGHITARQVMNMDNVLRKKRSISNKIVNRIHGEFCTKKRNKLTNAKKNYTNELISRLIKIAKANNVDVIAYENIEKVPMRGYKSRKENRVWGKLRANIFMEKLKHQVKLTGMKPRKVFPMHTSETCPLCGSLTVRQNVVDGKFKNGYSHMVCVRCNQIFDADIAAAHNIVEIANNGWESVIKWRKDLTRKYAGSLSEYKKMKDAEKKAVRKKISEYKNKKKTRYQELLKEENLGNYKKNLDFYG